MNAPAEQATIERLSAQVEKLTTAVYMLCTQSGTRITRQQLADRLGVHRNTLATRLSTDRSMPRPGTDGKWLLSEVIDWEQHRAQH